MAQDGIVLQFLLFLPLSVFSKSFTAHLHIQGFISGINALGFFCKDNTSAFQAVTGQTRTVTEGIGPLHWPTTGLVQPKPGEKIRAGQGPLGPGK